MFICDDFVFVHLPKTGGTFVTEILQKLYPNGIVHPYKHGTCSDIPKEYSHLPIVSVMRNPLDRYVSQYYYGWWKRNLELYCGDVCKTRYPNFDDISFADFVLLADEFFKGYFESKPNGYANNKAEPLGWHTEQYIRFYFKNPKKVFAELTNESIESGEYLSERFKVTILPNENLNQALYELLLSFGHSEKALDFLPKAERILPEGGQVRQDRNWLSHYTQETLEFIHQRERLLFNLYPQYQEKQIKESA